MGRLDSTVRRLTVIGEVDRPLVLHLGELLRLPAVERRVQIVCASGRVSDVVMIGVTLASVFALARVRA